MKWLPASVTVSPKHIRAMQQALFVQAIFVALTACVLDSGHTHWCTLTAVLAHWLGMVMILIRRPASPTNGDLWFSQWGYFPILAATVFFAPFFHMVLGRDSLLEHW